MNLHRNVEREKSKTKYEIIITQGSNTSKIKLYHIGMQ